MKVVISRITPALLDHDQSLVQFAIDMFSVLHRKLCNEILFDSLVMSIKFSSARALVIERLPRTIAKQDKENSLANELSVDESEMETKLVEEPNATHNETEDNKLVVETTVTQVTAVTESGEDMCIESDDDPKPITVDRYIVLDKEMGIELRVRPRPATPPVDVLAKTLSSVLQSPFPEEKDDFEMNNIDEQVEVDKNINEEVMASQEEINPFLEV